jgi:hypothetical protein
MTDQRPRARDRLELLPQGSWRGNDDSFQGQHGLGPRLDGRVAGDLQVADHLNPTGGRFGQAWPTSTARAAPSASR